MNKKRASLYYLLHFSRFHCIIDISKRLFAGLEYAMSDMNEYTPELIELVDNDGNKKVFELIDVAEVDGEQYYCMVPSVEDEDFLEEDCDIVVLKTIEEDGEEILASIDDDEEYDKVSAVFIERMKEAFEDEEF